MTSDKDYYGKTVILTEDVKYIGEGPDPKDDPYFMMVINAYCKVRKQLLLQDIKDLEDSDEFKQASEIKQYELLMSLHLRCQLGLT